MDVVGGAVAKVFFQKASEAHNRKVGLHVLVEEIFQKLVSIGLYPILMLTLIGKDAFIVLFGTRWAEAGVFVQFLGLMVFFRFISSPISTLFAVLEKQSYGLFFNGLLFSTRAASLIVGGMTDDVMLALFLFSSTGVVCYAFLCFWLISKAGVSILQALYHIVKYSVCSSPLLIIIALAKFSLGVPEIGVLLLGLCSLLVYYSLVIRSDEELRKPVYMLFQRVGFIK